MKKGAEILFPHAKLIDGLLFVATSWFQYHGWEIWMVWSVGEVLCLEAYGTAAWEGGAILTLLACSKVVGIDLNARLGGIDVHRAAALWLVDACGKTQFAFLFLVEYIAVVVTRTVADLFVVCVYVLSYCFRCAEVKWCSFYEAYLTCGDGGLVDGEVVICVYLALQVFYCWGWVGYACQAEESVVGQVDDGHLVGCGKVFYHQLVLVGPGIDHCNLHFAGVTFLTVCRDEFEHQCLAWKPLGPPWRALGPLLIANW